jgi:hypothetical protein
MNTLDHLQEMGIPLVCNKWITLPANPDLLNVDRLYDQNEKKKEKKASQMASGAGAHPTKHDFSNLNTYL